MALCLLGLAGCVTADGQLKSPDPLNKVAAPTETTGSVRP